MDNPHISLPLPFQLDHAFFFSSKQLVVERQFYEKNFSEPFIYEAFFYNGFETYRPWENSNEAIQCILEEWDKLKPILEELHRNRDRKQILIEMKKGLGLFIQMLFWTNGLPVIVANPIPLNQLEFKPVNISERLGFILSSPQLFHCFRQLSELMIEQQKLFIKKNIIKK